MSKITLKEFFDSKEILGIHCDTEEKANKLCYEFVRLNKKWISGKSYFEYNNWDEYEENTIYYNDGCIGDLEFAESESDKIYEFEDIIFDDVLTTYSEDASTILSHTPDGYIFGHKFDGKKRLTERTEKGYQIKFDGIHTQAQIVQMIIDVVGQLEDSLEAKK